MSKIKLTEDDLAYIACAADPPRIYSLTAVVAARAKLAMCVRHAREFSRDSWQDKKHKKFWKEATRDALIDAMYWREALACLLLDKR